MNDRPNVIVCLCDQLRAFSIGCYGDPVVRTPNIDRLAAEGVRFPTAVTNNPVCMPARSALLAGQWGRTCTGRLSNEGGGPGPAAWEMPQRPIPERKDFPDPTLAEAFAAAGYRTGQLGKWHIQPEPRAVGFQWSLYPLVFHRNSGQTFILPDGGEHTEPGWQIDYEQAWLERFLDDSAADGRPFLLYHNISTPHLPLADLPEKYLRMYDPGEVPIRPNAWVDGRLAHNEHWFRMYRWDFQFYRDHLPHAEQLPEGFDLRHLIALYYGAVTWTDDALGGLLTALASRGLDQNTIVLFTSDHGDNLGSHDAYNKGCLLEESLRTPMLVRWPAELSSRVCGRQLAQIIDVMPTVLGLAGVEAPPGVQGTDLSPVLRGRVETVGPNEAFIETPRNQIGLRTPRYLYGLELSSEPSEWAWRRRLTRRHPADPAAIDPDKPPVFYDLAEDPYQQRNLAGTGEQPEAERRLRAKLVDWHESAPWLTEPSA